MSFRTSEQAVPTNATSRHSWWVLLIHMNGHNFDVRRRWSPMPRVLQPPGANRARAEAPSPRRSAAAFVSQVFVGVVVARQFCSRQLPAQYTRQPRPGGKPTWTSLPSARTIVGTTPLPLV